MPYSKFQSSAFSLFLFVFFSLFLSAPDIFAQQVKLVETLDILGNRRLHDEEILKHIKTRPGERFDEERVQEDLQSLLTLGWFNKTNTRVITEPGVRGGVNVIFEVLELPIITEVNFKGLRNITKEELLTELRRQEATIEKGMPYDLIKTRNARRIITKYLKDRGFADAKVEVYEDSVTATTVALTFTIKELPNDEENNENYQPK